MLKGLPASGKTTAARILVDAEGNTGRVNRDDLRAMLFNSKWSGKREEIVISCEKAIAHVLGSHGFNVIIDDTNLKQSHFDMWSTFSSIFTFEEAALGRDISIDELEQRDALREKSVGRPVIERMALEAGLIRWTGKPIAIFDVDGTLGDCAWRRAFARGGVCSCCEGKPVQYCVLCGGRGTVEKSWEKFFKYSRRDLPIEAVAQWARNVYDSGEYELVILSGRPDTYGALTVDWLREIAVPFHHIFMRRGSDKRPDTEVKQDILKMMPYANVAFIVDDRQSVVDMWRRFREHAPANYHVFQVAEGNF